METMDLNELKLAVDDIEMDIIKLDKFDGGDDDELSDLICKLAEALQALSEYVYLGIE